MFLKFCLPTKGGGRIFERSIWHGMPHIYLLFSNLILFILIMLCTVNNIHDYKLLILQ